MKAERLKKQFAPRRVSSHGGIRLFPAADAIALVRAAAEEGVPILGLDGAPVTHRETEVPLEHLVDFTRHVADGHGCWQEAEAFIEERKGNDLLFDVALGDDPIEAV